jgi:anaerobic magnesium-protoporphyrin IX monomethyl ester cyclase
VQDGADKSFDQAKSSTSRAKSSVPISTLSATSFFGLPDDDIEAMQQTLALATELNCEFANF